MSTEHPEADSDGDGELSDKELHEFILCMHGGEGAAAGEPHHGQAYGNKHVGHGAPKH